LTFEFFLEDYNQLVFLAQPPRCFKYFNSFEPQERSERSWDCPCFTATKVFSYKGWETKLNFDLIFSSAWESLLHRFHWAEWSQVLKVTEDLPTHLSTARPNLLNQIE
jgi:hypothetical protein